MAYDIGSLKDLALVTSAVSTVTPEYPFTVDKLLVNYQRVKCINGDLCKFIEMVRAECNSLAESCPYAAEALHEVLRVAPDVNQANTGGTVTVGVAGVVATGKERSKGNGDVVLEGVVVKGLRVHETLQSGVEDMNKNSFPLPSVDSPGRDYREECKVLQLKLLAMGSAEQLLETLRMKVEELEERCTTQVSLLNLCHDELAKSRSECKLLLQFLTRAEGSNNTTISTDVGVISGGEERVLELATAKEEDVGSEGSSLTRCKAAASDEALSVLNKPSRRALAVRVVQAETALRESLTALEECETACKKMSHDRDQFKAAMEALVNERDMLKMHNTQLEGQLQRLLSSIHEDMREHQDAPGSVAPWRPGQEGGHEIALDVRDMKQRLQRLQLENQTLRSKVLQFQRQINDAELRAEDAGAGDDGAELRALREEVSRLQPAVHMKKLLLQKMSRERQCAEAQWKLHNRVHRTVIHHLLAQALKKKFLGVLLDRRKMTEVKAMNRGLVAEDFSADAIVKSSMTLVSVLEEEQEDNGSQEESEEHVAKGIQEVPTPTASCEVDQVTELHALLEAHEAKHRSSLKHWQQVNRELRTALAKSQEELRQQEGRIKLLEDTQGLCTTGVTVQKPVDTSGCSDELPQMQRETLWQMMQAENEVLNKRVRELQESKWSLDTLVDEYKVRCSALEREIAHNADTMNHLLTMGVIVPAATHIRGESSTDVLQLRSLQRMLHHALQDNMTLTAKLGELEPRSV